MTEPVRSVVRQFRVGLLVLLPLTSGCGDDDPTQVGVPDFSISSIANGLSGQSRDLILLNDAFQSLIGLSGSVAPVMTSVGFNPSTVPGASLDEAGSGARASILDIGARRSLAAAANRVAAAPPLALGATCDWSVQTNAYQGTTELFGPVPQNATFFELYTPSGVDDGLPAMPLERIGSFTSVQIDQQGSVLDVSTTVDQDGSTILDARITGTFGSPTIFDVALAGTVSDGSTIMDYAVNLDPTVIETSATIADIFLDHSLSLGPTNGQLILTIDESVSNKTVVFTATFDVQTLAILTGTVTLQVPDPTGGPRILSTIADLSGISISQPVITLTADSPLPVAERPLLADLFDAGDTVAGGLFDILLLQGCVGAEDNSFCSLLNLGRES